MDEIMGRVAPRAGMAQDRARRAAEGVVSPREKPRLGPLAAQRGARLSDVGAAGPQPGDVAQGPGGLFGA